MILNVLLVIALIVTAFMLLMTVSNVIFFKIATKKPQKAIDFASTKVSVLIPARNEERNIANCLNSFIDQSHKNFEVIVLDDNSTDNTYAVACSFKEKIPNLRVIRGATLPETWYGKQFASHQLAEASTGDVLVFADADTQQSQNCLLFGLTNLKAHNADLISGYPRQLLESFGEATLIPLMFLLMTLVQPFWLLKKSKRGFAAVGQFIMVKRDVYFAVGGFAAIPKVINDDLHFAGLVKRNGYVGIFLDLTEHVFVRMYHGFTESFIGLSKNIYTALNYNDFIMMLVPLFPVVLVHIPIFTFLIMFLGYGIINVLALVQIALMTTVAVIVALDRKLPFSATLYPVTYTFLGILGIYSLMRSKSNQGYVWRDRVVS